MSISIDKLWDQIYPLLTSFARKIEGIYPDVIHVVDRYSNEAFPLRAYMSFNREGSEQELAVTIDVRIIGKQAHVEFDLCADDGNLLASKPTIVIELPEIIYAGVFDDTVSKLRAFLAEVEPIVREEMGDKKDQFGINKEKGPASNF